MTKAWEWAKKNYKALVAGLGLLFAALAMAASRSNRINSPVTALRVRKEAKEIAKKEMEAATFEQAAEDKREEIAVLDLEIADSKKRVAEALHGPIVSGMTDAEIADLYRKSGL